MIFLQLQCFHACEKPNLSILVEFPLQDDVVACLPDIGALWDLRVDGKMTDRPFDVYSICILPSEDGRRSAGKEAFIFQGLVEAMLDLALFVLILHHNDLSTSIANDELRCLYGHRSCRRPDNKRSDMYGSDDLPRHDVSKGYGGRDKFAHIVPKRVDIEHCVIRAVIRSNNEAEVGCIVGARDDEVRIIGSSLLLDLTSRH